MAKGKKRNLTLHCLSSVNVDLLCRPISSLFTCPSWSAWKNTKSGVSMTWSLVQSRLYHAPSTLELSLLWWLYSWYQACCQILSSSCASPFVFVSIKLNSNTGGVFVSQQVVKTGTVVQPHVWPQNIYFHVVPFTSAHLRNKRFHWLCVCVSVCPLPSPCWWCWECVRVVVLITQHSLNVWRIELRSWPQTLCHLCV